MKLSKRFLSKKRPVSDINVVPYIDVMLVLLVIFMITAPLLSQGVHVQLPQASAKPLPPKKEEPIIVSVNQQGEIFLNVSDHPMQPIAPQDLMSQVSTLLQRDQSQQQTRDIYVKGDRDASYGQIVNAMVLLQKAGATDVGLITKPAEQ